MCRAWRRRPTARRTALLLVVFSIAVAVANARNIMAFFEHVNGDVVVIDAFGVRVDASELGAPPSVTGRVRVSLTRAFAAVTAVVACE